MKVSQNWLLHRNVDFMNCEKMGETDKFVKLELEHKDRLFDEVNHVKAISKETFDKLSGHWLDKHWLVLHRKETATMVRKHVISVVFHFLRTSCHRINSRNHPSCQIDFMC